MDASDVQLVAAAAITSERGPLGVRVMEAGTDYFTDKAPFTTLAQLEEAREAAARTGRKYAVYYSERLHSEAGVHAGTLVHEGVIGRVVQVLGLGPHRLNARVVQAFAGNFGNPEHPELEDYGEATLVAPSGARNFFRVDWFTPDALPTWGDGRTVILGTEGYIELRKYVDVGRDATPDHLYLVTNDRHEHMALAGEVGYPYFGQLILDCLERTERAMSQAHAFEAAELCLRAQAVADAAGPDAGAATGRTG